MKHLLVYFILVSSLLASKIISYNIYDRTQRVDLMITFDLPYTGTIKQSRHNSKIIIKLSDAQIESSKVKQLSTKFLHSITLTPLGDSTQIVASVPKNVRFIASKTTDGYGLRLRFTNKPVAKKLSDTNPNLNLSNLPTKKETSLSTQYYIVIAIMFVGIIILLFIQKKIKNAAPKKSPWLFKETKSSPSTQENPTTNEVSIRFQKSIDEKNSVAMIDFGEQSYLVLMGENNILLDKYVDNKPTTQEDFNSILQARHQELDEFLKVEQQETQVNDIKKPEPLQSYQQKAASLIYSEES